MDQELKDYLDQRFAEVDRRFTEKIDAAKTSMFQRRDEMAATLEDGYRDTQTEVPKAVYSMEERLQLREDAQEAIIAGIQKRQALVEARLLEIEKRLHLPPAA